jgi:hypothetical protein
LFSFLCPVPEKLFFTALDAASINMVASALTPDFAKSVARPFPFLALFYSSWFSSFNA